MRIDKLVRIYRYQSNGLMPAIMSMLMDRWDVGIKDRFWTNRTVSHNLIYKHQSANQSIKYNTQTKQSHQKLHYSQYQMP
jgi:hypothetical protein